MRFEVILMLPHLVILRLSRKLGEPRRLGMEGERERVLEREE